MAIKNISGTPYYTVDDIQRPELKQYLSIDASLTSIGKAGHDMSEYLSKLTIDPEMHSGLQDLMVLFGILQSKALEIRLLSTQLKYALKLEVEEDSNK